MISVASPQQAIGRRAAWVLAVLMAAVALLGAGLRVDQTAPKGSASFSLEQMVPLAFGEWNELKSSSAQIVDPGTKQLLDKLYSQLLTRTYVNARGYRIMLSVAYSNDQRGELQAHKPESCYPSQGFALRSNEEVSLPTQFGTIRGRRLETHRSDRYEPVTYWFTMGDQTILSQAEMRVAQLRMALTGRIPDGLLFRVSSVDPDAANAFRIQSAFVDQLLRSVGPGERARLSGL